MEPTSTPRVGWEAMNSRSGRESSRAITTFCWLPPDSVPAAAAADGVRTSNSPMRDLAFSTIFAGLMLMPLAKGGLS
jgi:hypothetical protein